VARDEVVRRERAERVARRRDDRLEERAAQVKAADDGVDVLLAGQLPHVAHDVHDAGMAAAGEDHQAAPTHLRDEGLVVEDQRIGLPRPVAVGLVTREALLEVRRPVDLAGHQQRAVEQKRGLALLDDLEARPLERALARRRQLDGITAGQRQPATAPELGMDEDGNVGPAELPDQPVHPGGVIPVTVAQHDHVDVARRDLQPAHVLDQAVRCPSGIEQDPRLAVALGDRHQTREAVLGPQGVARPASFDESRRHPGLRPQPHRRPLRRTLVDEQHVGHVVDQRGDRQRVDGLERKRFHFRLSRHRRRRPLERLRGRSPSRLAHVLDPLPGQ